MRSLVSMTCIRVEAGVSSVIRTWSDFVRWEALRSLSLTPRPATEAKMTAIQSATKKICAAVPVSVRYLVRRLIVGKAYGANQHKIVIPANTADHTPGIESESGDDDREDEQNDGDDVDCGLLAFVELHTGQQI